MQDYDEALDHLSGRRRSSYFQGKWVWGLGFAIPWDMDFQEPGLLCLFFSSISRCVSEMQNYDQALDHLPIWKQAFCLSKLATNHFQGNYKHAFWWCVSHAVLGVHQICLTALGPSCCWCWCWIHGVELILKSIKWVSEQKNTLSRFSECYCKYRLWCPGLYWCMCVVVVAKMLLKVLVTCHAGLYV